MVIDLVEPSLTGGETRATRERSDALGKTAMGFTPISTTAAAVHDLTAARAFYEGVLGMQARIDTVFTGEEMNRLMHLPTDRETHVVFLAGDHVFGKVVLLQPLNYRPPDRVAAAAPPNIGYLAQGFQVADIGRARDAAANCGAQTLNPGGSFALPGLSGQGAIFMLPGSGARVWLYQED